MTPDRAKERLAELKSQKLPRLDWRTFITIGGADALPAEIAEAEKTFTDYFSKFVLSPRDDQGRMLCISCNRILASGGVLDVLLGSTFQWSLAHGEGKCGECGWPARALHYDVGPIKRFKAIFQYHPDEVTERTNDDRDHETDGS